MLKKLVFAALAVMFVVAGVYLLNIGKAQGAQVRAAAASAPEDLWVVGTGGLMKVDANTGARQAPITAPTLPFSVAIDPQRGLVWVVALNGLFAFDFSGQQVVHTNIPLPCELREQASRSASPGGAAEGSSDSGPIAPLVADPQSGDLWLALGPFLYHFDSQGLRLAVYTLPDAVVSLALKEDAGALWAATKKNVFRVDVSTGALTTPFDLGQKPKVQTLSLNPESGALWVVLKDEIRRFDATGQLSLIKTLNDVDLLDAIPDGGAWVLRKKEFFKLDEAGEGQLQFAQPHDLRPTLSLGTDPRDGSLWALSLKALGHFGTDGQPQLFVAFPPNEMVALDFAIYTDTTAPVVHITAPQEGTLTNNNRPPLAVEYSDAGTGVDADSLAFTSNGQPLAVSCGTTPTGATCTPVDSIPDGPVTLSATVKDLAGITSQVSTVHFTVDTTPPTLTLLAPEDGLLTNHASVAFSADAGEAVTATLNGDPVASTPEGLISGTLTLTEGTNAFELHATDAAGNPAVLHFTVTRDTTPPVLTLLSPPNGLLTNQPQVALSASAGEAVTATLNGQPLASTPEGAISGTLSLAEGINAFELSATDLAGNPAVLHFTATRDTVPPAAVILAKVEVTLPVGGSVTVTGQPGAAEPNTAVTVSNSRTGEALTLQSGAAGTFACSIAALTGDIITLTPRDAAGNAGQAVSVTVQGGVIIPPEPVAPPLDPAVPTPFSDQTSFLYTGPNAIQTGVTPGAIDPRRVTVLRGRAFAQDGQPVPGAKVTVLGQVELGQTLTRASGAYDIAVNGGGSVILAFEKAGLLALQRQVPTSFNEYTSVPDIVMTALDPQVTAVVLTSPADMQVARGSVMTENGGAARQATLLIPAGTQATMQMPGGGTQPLTTLNIRATEFTVGTNGPSAMPAELPSQSGYTYCVELSADEAIAAGATSVTLSQPVPFYVENFIGAPVGSGVPAGYYDRQSGQWRADLNGRVIKVLGATGGMVNLDVDGTGVAADPAKLAALGITDPERTRLATLYAAGTELWRVRLSHFTPWDCNWPYGPPPTAIAPGNIPPSKPIKDKPRPLCGSIIGAQNQSLSEVAGVAGAPFSLYYHSDRMPGRKDAFSLRIPFRPANVPPELLKIKIEVSVGGRLFTHVVNPSQNPTENIYDFTWDGLDVYGRRPVGASQALVRIGYAYTPYYYSVGKDVVYSFMRLEGEGSAGTGGGLRFTRANGTGGGGNAVTSEFYVWQSFKTALGVMPPVSQGLGGWTPSIVHQYDPSDRAIYYGDGDKRSQSSTEPVVRTIAGGGTSYDYYSGLPGTRLATPYPRAMTSWPDGSILFIQASLILRIDANGNVTCISGHGISDADGIPATQASLYAPQGLAVGPDGSIFVSLYSNKVRKIGPDGLIYTVAGNGTTATSGDGGPATQAGVNYGTHLAVGPDGSLYIVQSSDHRIRRVAPDGIITTFAGTGVNGFSGDGGPASAAKVGPVTSIAAGPDGSIYLADVRRIRRVGPDGVIRTIAGDGSVGGFAGDGGPAALARFSQTIGGLDVTRDGRLLIADTWNGRIRQIDTTGTINTLAGTGNFSAFTPDGRPGLQNQLWLPNDATATPDGTVVFADTYNNRIRKLAPPLPGYGGQLSVASEDGSELFVFDFNGRHIKTLNAVTGAVVFQFEYSSAGLLATVTDGDGNLTTIERDGSGNATGILSPDGVATALVIGGDGYLASIANPKGEATHFVYSTDGLMATLTDPKAQLHTFTYDPATGRLLKDEDPEGGYKALGMTRTDTGWTTTVTTAEGRSTTYAEELLASGDQRSTVSASGCACNTAESLTKRDGTTQTTSRDGTVTTFLEGPDPRLGMQSPLPQTVTVKLPSGLTSTMNMTRAVTQTDPNNPLTLQTQTDTVTVNGKVATSVYNAAAKTVTVTTPQNRTATTTLDAQGRVTRELVPGIEAVNFSYDTHGRLNGVSQGTRSSSLAYNAQGRVESVTDPLSRQVSFVYDAAGQVTSQTLPDGRQIGFSYDPNGNVTSVTPPSRPAHSFAYTRVDLQGSYTPPDVGIGNTATTYAYNKDRQVTGITRPDGQTIGLGYDVLGRASTVTAPNGTTTLAYEPQKGTLESVTTPDGIVNAYTWDGSLPKGETLSGPVSGSISRSFNSDLRLASVSVNGANPVAYTYDSDGLLTSAGALALARDASNGLLAGTTLGNVADAQGYTSYGELQDYSASYPGGLSYSVSYTRDGIGRISTKTETVNGTVTAWVYSYDTVGRLSDVLNNGAPYAHYEYDANGNRLARADGAGNMESGVYDNQDRMLSYGTNTYAYTANGELTTKTDTANGQATSYQYDVFGNLRNVVLPDNTSIDYLIDARNRRIGKKLNGTLTKGWLYDGQLRPIAELNGSGSVVSRFVYATHINVPDYMVKGGVTYRIITDHLGSPRFVVDTATGNIAQRMDFDEFGRLLLDTNPGFQPFGFAGGLYDPQSSLIRFGARDYDVETGRWTSKDLLGFAAGDSDLYCYNSGDPINFTDASGLWTAGVGINAFAGLGITPAGGGGWSIVIDGKGNFAIMRSQGFGAMSSINGSLSVSVEGTGARDVFDQANGPNLYTGASVGEVVGGGADIISCPDYGGFSVSGGLTVRTPLPPFEMHGLVVSNDILYSVNPMQEFKDWFNSQIPKNVPFYLP